MSFKRLSEGGKKAVIFVLLTAIFVSSLLINIVFYEPKAYIGINDPIIFLPVTDVGPYTIDPINSWDSASNDVIEQVCEGLFMYNLSDPTMPRINILAEDYEWLDITHIRIKAREGVVFHDNYQFNAAVIKWNLDRINYLTNATGELPSDMMAAEPASLYLLPNGTAIMKEITIESEWWVQVELSAPFAPFLDLLCYTASYMISPGTHDQYDYIPKNGDLVGTGPYKYEYFVSNVEVRFTRWDNYWRGKAFFDEVALIIIADSITRNNAMLNHEVEYISRIEPSFIDQYEADPRITVKHFTDDTNIPGLSYYYLGMNNNYINQTMRKAISYAINHSYLIEVIGNNLVVRANSPISPGYGIAYNDSVQVATFDIIRARQVLVDAGISSLDLNDDIGWRAAEYAIYNYTYNFDNSIRAEIGVALTSWLNEIGITVIDDVRLFGYYDKLVIFWGAWGPDYLDPFNMLDLLFNPTSIANGCKVNDQDLNDLLAEALETADDNARYNIYKKIQWYLAERLYPHCFGYHPKLTYAHYIDIKGIPYNVMGKLYVYPIYRV